MLHEAKEQGSEQQALMGEQMWRKRDVELSSLEQLYCAVKTPS
jgi:hypothetical protein